jgi:hypothetical protein
MKVKLNAQCGVNAPGTIHDVLYVVPHGGYSDSARQYVLHDGTFVISDNADVLAGAPDSRGVQNLAIKR